ncbi:MAG: hypothetical protein J4F39_11370 [Candidatus Latescibacteria bacterium]|nr:hypothetical protein [Candidatus Latescibacterota bacterium]
MAQEPVLFEHATACVVSTVLSTRSENYDDSWGIDRAPGEPGRMKSSSKMVNIDESVENIYKRAGISRNSFPNTRFLRSSVLWTDLSHRIDNVEQNGLHAPADWSGDVAERRDLDGN